VYDVVQLGTSNSSTGTDFGGRSKGLTQLLDDPLGSRVSGHVEVQNLPTSVLDDEEAVHYLEGQRGHGERVARACDCHFQKSRNPARCQLTTVSGFTATRTSAHRDQMQWRVIQNSRSNGFNRGRGCFRLRRMSCCRKARISKAVSFRLRKKTRTAARRARMNRSMNPSL
jgi:hypothetical protein